MVLPGRNQQGSAEAAEQGKRSEQLRILSERECDRRRRNHNHGDEGDGGRDEVIELKRRPQRQVKGADPQSLQGIRKCLMTTAAEALAPDDQSRTSQQTDHDPAGLADPVIVEGKLQEISDAGQYSENSDAIQPILANFLFEAWRCRIDLETTCRSSRRTPHPPCR